jgi:hypothetical protein
LPGPVVHASGDQELVNDVAVMVGIDRARQPDHVAVTLQRQLPDAVVQRVAGDAVDAMRQVDHVHLSLMIVGNGGYLGEAIVEVLENEPVGARSARDPVVAGTAIEVVVAGRAEETIVAAATVQPVVAVAAVEMVVAEKPLTTSSPA